MARRWGAAPLGSIVVLLLVLVVLLRPWDWGAGNDGVGASEHLAGRVLRAVDGDTLEIAIDGGATETVRLIGIDTPETVKPDTPVQCFGPQASAWEHHNSEGRRVKLLTGVEPRDVYGRLLAYVYLDEGPLRGRMIETILMRRGLARILTFPPNDRFAPVFTGLQSRAAGSGRGLWGAC